MRKESTQFTVNDKQFNFEEPISSFIEIDNKVIIVITPIWENHEQYRQSFKALNGSNVYVIDKRSETQTKLPFISIGVERLSDFWIKPHEQLDENKHYWLTTYDEAHLINTEKMKIVRSINTHILK